MSRLLLPTLAVALLAVSDARPDAVRDALDLLNAERNKAGSPPVTLDSPLSKKCAAHAIANAERLPGSSVARVPILNAMKAWLAGPLHREFLLSPKLKSVGLGEAGRATVIAGIFTPPQTDKRAVAYPGDEQVGVPLIFPGDEVPDPLPKLADKITGYPVTVTFRPDVEVAATSMTMEDESGTPVPLHVSGPDNVANPRHPNHQANTLCAFATKPLRPATRYLVRATAKADGKPWSRTWSFVTAAREPYPGKRAEAAVARLNTFRKAAGLGAVALDSSLSRGCQLHAAYLGRHLIGGKRINVYKEDPSLEGYTKEGAEAADESVIKLQAGDTPDEGIDWLLTSILNRNHALNPTTRRVGVGIAPQGRGHAWVIRMPLDRRPGDSPPIVYPGDRQKGVPVDFGRDLAELRPGSPRAASAGFPITVLLFPETKVADVKASLADADGKDVPIWLSTPDKKLPGTGRQEKIVLVPRAPLVPERSYTAEVSARLDGKAYSRKWTFTTRADPHPEAVVAKRLIADLNAIRKAAGLGEVMLDETLSKGCRLHAAYLEKNIDHPKSQGLDIHDEDADLPGYTKEGKAAARVSVIAAAPDPTGSVAMWAATLYHRIPLLSPSLKKVGYGQGWHQARGYITVMDVSGAR